MPSIPRSLLIIRSIIIRHRSGTGNRQHSCFRIDRPSDIDFIAYSSTTAVIHCRLYIVHPRAPEKEREKEYDSMYATYHMRGVFQISAQKYCFFHKKHSQIVQIDSQIVQIYSLGVFCLLYWSGVCPVNSLKMR